MYLIQGITEDARQRHSVLLPDNTTLLMTLVYRELQQGWFIDELTYLDFTLGLMRVTNHPNMLHQYKNILPFGLACFSEDGREPMVQGDFASSQSNLYILSAEEVALVTEHFKGEA